MKQQPDRVRNCNGSNNKLSVLLPKIKRFASDFCKTDHRKSLILQAFKECRRIPTPWKAGTVSAAENQKYTFCTFCA